MYCCYSKLYIYNTLSLFIDRRKKIIDLKNHKPVLSLIDENLGFIEHQSDNYSDNIGTFNSNILLKQLCGKTTGLVLYGDYAGLVGLINLENKTFAYPRLINEITLSRDLLRYKP